MLIKKKFKKNCLKKLQSQTLTRVVTIKKLHDLKMEKKKQDANKVRSMDGWLHVGNKFRLEESRQIKLRVTQ